MSGLVGTGHKVWSGLYLFSSTVGFIILMVLLQVFYISPYQISTWWYKGFLLIACMAVSILIFGGAVIGLWHLWETRIVEREGYDDDGITVDKTNHNENLTPKDSSLKHPSKSTLVKYGVRPEFKGKFAGQVLFLRYMYIPHEESFINVGLAWQLFSFLYVFLK